MRLMGWDMDIVHRNDHHLADADYWSRVGADLCFDLLLRRYLEISSALVRSNPPTKGLPLLPENMPYYRSPRFPYMDSAPDDHMPAAQAAMVLPLSAGTIAISNRPVAFLVSVLQSHFNFRLHQHTLPPT